MDADLLLTTSKKGLGMSKLNTNKAQPLLNNNQGNPFATLYFELLPVLVEKKGENHQPEALEKLLGKMYSLFEYMLGKTWSRPSRKRCERST